MRTETTLLYAVDGTEFEYLRESDAALGRMIDAQGDLELVLPANRFNSLARAIVGQQLSLAAAKTIWGRLMDLAGESTAERLASLDTERLRTIGLSNAKARYVVSLAQGVAEGSVDLDSLDSFDDEAAIDYLTRLKGVGRWTAEMFLIFSLGRPDVFAVDDVGLRRAMRLLYGPETQDAHLPRLASKWEPYRSVASLCLWRGLDDGTLG